MNTIAADIIISPEMTPLLFVAEKLGCKIRKGKAILEEQVKLTLKFMNRY